MTDDLDRGPGADKIREELIRRELARKNLGEFTRRTYPNYIDCKHQDMLNEKLQAVERYIESEGKDGIPRLLVTMPPRHGKSEKVSVRFPAWFLGRNPNKRVIIASYGAELAEDWSRKVRNLVESDEYSSIFGKRSLLEKPIEVDSEARRVQSWDLKGYQGGFVASGVGGSITGRGAHLFIIDDPVKDREEADSETIRRKTKEWYTSVARTRMQKGGAIIVMMTRWHEDDLIGWLLETQDHKWELLNLPGLAYEDGSKDGIGRLPGEALWPAMFDKEALEDIREDVGPRDFQSLYQQRPTADDGEMFKREWFTYDKLPHRDDINRGFQVWDTAFTEKKKGDYSACATFYVTRDGIFLADMYRAHLGLPQLKEMIRQKKEQWDSFFRIGKVYVENKGSGMSVIQALKKDYRLPIVPIDPEKEEGKSKTARADAASAYVQSGRVIFKRDAPWLTDFEDELLKFPNAKNDDMVDAFAYGVLKVQGGAKPPRRSYGSYKENISNLHSDRLTQLMGAW